MTKPIKGHTEFVLSDYIEELGLKEDFKSWLVFKLKIFSAWQIYSKGALTESEAAAICGLEERVFLRVVEKLNKLTKDEQSDAEEEEHYANYLVEQLWSEWN